MTESCTFSRGLKPLAVIIAICGYQMDDGGHRENGRHKADQYKTAQSQVLEATFYKQNTWNNVNETMFFLVNLWGDDNTIAVLVAVVDATSAINETDNGHYG